MRDAVAVGRRGVVGGLLMTTSAGGASRSSRGHAAEWTAVLLRRAARYGIPGGGLETNGRAKRPNGFGGAGSSKGVRGGVLLEMGTDG